MDEIRPGVLLTLQVLPKWPHSELVEFALALPAHECAKRIGGTDFASAHRCNLFANRHFN
jgi:hypothetical protein